MSKEPKRMSEEPSVLGASVAAARDTKPSDERLAALAARLSAAGAHVDFRPPAPAERAAETAPPAARLERAAPWGRRALVVGLFALGGAGLVTAKLARRSSPAPAPSAAATPLTTRAAPDVSSEAKQAAPHEPEASRANPSANERMEGAPRFAVPSAAPEPAAPPSAPTPRELVTRAPNASTSATPSTSARASANPNAKPSGAQTAHAGRSAAGRLATSTSDGNSGAPLAASNVVTSELEFLKRARSALAADPAQAYALTERCRAQYPSGELAQEREYIAISALVRLGRGSEASSRAALFRMHYPSSAYLPRLERVLGEP